MWPQVRSCALVFDDGTVVKVGAHLTKSIEVPTERRIIKALRDALLANSVPGVNLVILVELNIHTLRDSPGQLCRRYHDQAPACKSGGWGKEERGKGEVRGGGGGL
jgi:hypothetical protein